MAFTVEDFEDLVQLLEQRPEWRARLRDLLLPREVLELPAAVADLAEISRAALARLDRIETWQQGADRRFEQIDRRFDEVGRRFDGVDGRLAGVDGRLAGVDGRLDRLEGGVQQLSADMDDVKAALRRLDDSVGELRGSTWELRFRVNPDLWFSELIADPVAVNHRQVQAMLEAYVAEGRLTPAEASHIRRADLVIVGSEDGEPACLIVEASRTVSPYDVQRAADRAILLRKATPRVRAVAAGKFIRADAAELAERRGVIAEVEAVVERDPMAD